MKWLQSLRETDELTPQTWHCRPLVVVGSEGEVAFAGDSDVEFVPEDRAGLIGWAVRLTPDEFGFCHRLHIESRIEPPYTGLGPSAPGRAWLVVMGTNSAGLPETWYLDGAADEYLTRN